MKYASNDPEWSNSLRNIIKKISKFFSPLLLLWDLEFFINPDVLKIDIYDQFCILFLQKYGIMLDDYHKL